MLEQIDNMWVQGKYIFFHDEGLVSERAVTHVFSVADRMSKTRLGTVKWFMQWRKYCFFASDSVFDHNCLRDIADFCEMKTIERRAKREVEKARLIFYQDKRRKQPGILKET